MKCIENSALENQLQIANQIEFFLIPDLWGGEPFGGEF